MRRNQRFGRNQRLQIADRRLQIGNPDSVFYKSAICNLQSAIARTGFTLIEVLSVMVVIGFLFSAIAGTILATVRMEKAEAAVYHKMVSQYALADQFRADVAGALSTPHKLKEWVKGPTCLILKTGDTSHIVYLWQDGNLERVKLAGKHMEKQHLPLGEKKVMVEFAAGTESPTQLILRLKGPPPRPAIEIAAALGGDRK